MRTLKQINGGL